MKQLYKALFDLILSIQALLPDGVSDTLIKHIDKYHSQPEFMDGGVPFHVPAVFVEIPRVNWVTLKTGAQKGEGLLRFHIVQYTAADMYQNTYNGSENQDIAFQILDVIDTLNAALQGWQCSSTLITTSPLDRVASLADTRHDIVSVDILEYRCMIYDYTMVQTGETVPLTLKLFGEIDRGSQDQDPTVKEIEV